MFVLAALLATGSSHAPLPAAAALPKVPTMQELSQLSAGLARIDYLLDNWDRETTVCTGVSGAGDLEDAQVVRTMNQNKCYKTPLRVQKFIGASSTLDPLFKADQLMIRAQPLVGEADAEAYADAVDAFVTKQQMSSTMAYTSSWSGFENPGGSSERIEENLLEAKKEVLETRATLKRVVDLLRLPPAPPYSPATRS